MKSLTGEQVSDVLKVVTCLCTNEECGEKAQVNVSLGKVLIPSRLRATQPQMSGAFPGAEKHTKSRPIAATPLSGRF
jgi:hypothetical protein